MRLWPPKTLTGSLTCLKTISRRIFCFSCMLIAAPFMAAQGPPGGATSISLRAVIARPFQIPAGSNSSLVTFPVYHSDFLHLSVLLPVANLTLNLLPPVGASLPWTTTATAYDCAQVPVQVSASDPVTAMAYQFLVPSPGDGVWQLQVAFPAPLNSAWSGVLAADFSSSLNAGLFSSSPTLCAGQTVNLALALVDGSTVVTDATCSASLQGPDGNTTPLTFQGVTDSTTGGETLTAQVSPQIPGTYLALVDLTGTLNGLPYERTVSTSFTLNPQPAQVAGPITDSVELAFPPPLP